MEPCCGDGALIRHLSKYVDCVYASDIEPRGDFACEDALSICDDYEADLIITNPPWDRKLLHPMIEHFRSIAPAWLLFDAGWMHTKQAAPYLEYCAEIVSVGRVKWIPDSKMTGKDNCCWYLFSQTPTKYQTRFYGKKKRPG